MTRVTCRLTAKNWDLLRNLTLGSQVWVTYFYKHTHPEHETAANPSCTHSELDRRCSRASSRCFSRYFSCSSASRIRMSSSIASMFSGPATSDNSAKLNHRSGVCLSAPPPVCFHGKRTESTAPAELKLCRSTALFKHKLTTFLSIYFIIIQLKTTASELRDAASEVPG